MMSRNENKQKQYNVEFTSLLRFSHLHYADGMSAVCVV